MAGVVLRGLFCRLLDQSMAKLSFIACEVYGAGV